MPTKRFFKISAIAFMSMIALTGCRSFVTGIAGAVGKSTVEERTFGETIDDATIHAEITHYFVQADVNDMLPNVTARVREGRVLLTGTVEREATAREAVRLTWIAKGVKEVINTIEVNDKTTILDDVNDGWIETQIETRLLATQKIRSLNYTVEVENNVVYLLGVAQNEEELRRVTHIASITKGVKKVVSYVRPADHPATTERE